MLLGQISDVLDILAAELQKPLVETDHVLIGLENIDSILADLAAIGELHNEERLFALLKMIIEEVEGSNSMTVMSREQLLFLLESHFRVSEIARIFGVSIRTIRRRMSEYGLSVRQTYILTLLMNNFGNWFLTSLSIFQMLEEGVLLDISVLVEFCNFFSLVIHLFIHSFTTHFTIIIFISK